MRIIVVELMVVVVAIRDLEVETKEQAELRTKRHP
jgi:hypothetical protein